jgi:hypothetical protein
VKRKRVRCDKLGGVRSLLLVPMLKEGEVVGCEESKEFRLHATYGMSEAMTL